ncbi:MAG: GNAT family N-acetyltransferase [Candidatus Obscuribacterales bacterium]|nr:GNAT family N-acetyltransferase [Candidatus Obscuribacterales bacterium]
MDFAQLDISPVTEDELTLAADLRAEMAADMGNDWDSQYDGWRKRFIEYFGAKQSEGKSQLFFARVDGVVVGISSASMVDDYRAYVHGRKTGRINGVYVRPAYRKNGIARNMMVVALDWLANKGCVVARLHTSEEGKHLYESLGFLPFNEMEYVF